MNHFRYMFGLRITIWSTGKVEYQKVGESGTFGIYIKAQIRPARRNLYKRTGRLTYS